jgi:hypothetical protein
MSLCHSTDTRAPSPSVTIDVNGRLPGGIYAPEKDSVFVITPRGQQGFPVYVPAGIETSYNENPSFKEESGGPSHWKAYCPEDLVLHELDAISNEILESPIIIRVHHGPNDYDTYNLAAGTRIQTALEHCPSCLSTAADGTTRYVASGRVDGQCEAETGSSAGLGSPKISKLPHSIRVEATVYQGSEFTTGAEENYRCATRGGIKVIGGPTGKGYFLVQPSGPDTEINQGSGPIIEVYDKYEKWPDELANRGETAANGVPGRGSAIFMPFGHYHQNLVTAETPVIVANNYPGYTTRTADQTYIGNLPIPNKALRELLPAWNRKIMERCETMDRQSQQVSCSD